jgi:tetratricopeptide (TPR) repeat protein
MSLLGKWFGFASDEVYDEGIAAYDRGAYDEAIEAFESCLQDSNDPNISRLARFYMVQSHAQLGAAAFRRGQYLIAGRHYEEALAFSPHFPDLNLNAARAYRELYQQDRRDYYLRQALKANPRYFDAIVFDAVVRYEKGHHAEALCRLLDACDLSPEVQCDLFMSVLDAYEHGYHQQAVQNMLALMPDGSGDAQVHVRLGDSFARDRMISDAIAEYEKAISLAPNYADVHYKLGKLYLDHGHLEDAALAFSEAIQINEDYADAHAQLGVAMRRLRKEKEAQNAFRRALELNPEHQVALRSVA